MQSKTRFIILALIASFGIYLLGNGMTGMVAKSSDCINCVTFSQINAMWGALMLFIVVVAIFAVYHHNNK